MAQLEAGMDAALDSPWWQWLWLDGLCGGGTRGTEYIRRQHARSAQAALRTNKASGVASTESTNAMACTRLIAGMLTTLI